MRIYYLVKSMVREEEYNEMMSKFAANIPTECDAYNTIRQNSSEPNNLSGADLYNMTDFEAYRNDVEFVNAFPKQVLIDEEKYFVKRYSRKVYDELLSKRVAFKEQKKIERANLVCKQKIADLGTIPCKPTKENCTSNSCKEFQTIDHRIENDYVRELRKQNPLENPATLNKKVEYRKESHDYLSMINQILTYLYYVVLVGMLVLFTMKGELHFMERAIVYLLLLVLPFLFPYLFDVLTYLYLWVFPDSPIHGPKNAFLDLSFPIQSYNI